MTAGDSISALHKGSKQAVSFYREDKILATRWMEAASSPKQWTDQNLIGSNHVDRQETRKPTNHRQHAGDFGPRALRARHD